MERGLGFTVLGFRVLRIKVYGLGFRVWGRGVEFRTRMALKVRSVRIVFFCDTSISFYF